MTLSFTNIMGKAGQIGQLNLPMVLP